MAKLFSENLTREDILRRVGNISQIAGVKSYTMNEGRAEGVRAVDVRTGGGLSYTVMPGRALDISMAEFFGTPVSFLSKSGIANAAYFDADQSPWGSSFAGGLVTTCGLTNVGVCEDYNGRRMPIHGDIANIPAHNVGAFEQWEGDELKIGVRGKVRQAVMYLEELELTREVSSYLGQNKITICDTVENLGSEKQPFMYLYHINFGYPMISKDTVLEINTAKTTPAGDDPNDVNWFAEYKDAGVDCEHHCVHHDLIPENGKVKARLVNKKLGIAITIEFDKAQLKNFTQWKLMANGDYVTGLEPCNNYGLGTAGEEKNGTLEYLQPFEKREIKLEISFDRI